MLENFKLRKTMKRVEKEKRQSGGNKSAAERDSFDSGKQDPEGYEIYKKVSAGAKPFIFYPAIFVSFAVLIPLIAVLRSELAAWFILSVIGLLIFQEILNMIRYNFYFKGWRKKLPFPLKGWEELIRKKKIYCDLCWTDITVTVVPKKEKGVEAGLVEAAMVILSRRARKSFYQAEAGSVDRRKRWESGGWSASGSVNPEGLKSLKRTCQKELAYIGKKYSAIAEVQIKTDSDEYEVPIEISSSEGTAS